MKDKEILEAMNKKSALNYLKKATKTFKRDKLLLLLE